MPNRAGSGSAVAVGQDLDRMVQILRSLPKGDREAVIRFYHGEHEDRIEHDLGLASEYLRELRRSVKARFLQGRSVSA